MVISCGEVEGCCTMVVRDGRVAEVVVQGESNAVCHFPAGPLFLGQLSVTATIQIDQSKPTQ